MHSKVFVTGTRIIVEVCSHNPAHAKIRHPLIKQMHDKQVGAVEKIVQPPVWGDIALHSKISDLLAISPQREICLSTAAVRAIGLLSVPTASPASYCPDIRADIRTATITPRPPLFQQAKTIYMLLRLLKNDQCYRRDAPPLLLSCTVAICKALHETGWNGHQQSP